MTFKICYKKSVAENIVRYCKQKEPHALAMSIVQVLSVTTSWHMVAACLRILMIAELHIIIMFIISNS